MTHLDPTGVRAKMQFLYHLAQMHLQAARSQAALLELEKAYACCPDPALNIGDKSLMPLRELIRTALISCLLGLSREAIAAKQYEPAERWLSQLFDYPPLTTESLFLLGSYFYERGFGEAAETYFEQVLAADPIHAEAMRMLGDTFYFLRNDNVRALPCYEAFVRLYQSNQSVYNLLGHLHYYLTGDIQMSLKDFERALEIQPDFKTANDNLMMGLLKDDSLNQAGIFERACTTMTRFLNHSEYGKLRPMVYVVDRDPERRLHIGYLSSNLFSHPTFYYLYPMLKAHQLTEIDVSCYSSSPNQDHVVKNYVSQLPGINFVHGLNETQLADKIRADRIDILVDASGFEANNRTMALLARPAPIQVSYMAYINTYGLPPGVVDYILTASDLVEPHEQAWYRERFFHLEPYCVYARNDHEWEPVSELPALKRGYVTFGVFNQLAKITDQTLQAWAEILSQVPESRLMLCRDKLDWPAVERRLVQAGMPLSQVQVETFAYSKYHLCDLQLDTFHYSGMTINLDSLSMGVPVLTWPQVNLTGRMGGHINRVLGLEVFNANSREDYCQKAVWFARHPQVLAEYRLTMRQRLADSPLSDPDAFAKGLEAAYRQMWRNFCRA
ncbi:MAG: hypothetical protein CVV27_10785 [Candidatus Melainabacteria bacterium HGW-Melainabacteria-1]|nr:MAG: hypothetical protein CVV27_10785 [Candidatus Melainabacteria bacterium HGW-Melainabacteria-1]